MKLTIVTKARRDRVLFLISLPDSPEFATYADNVADCVRDSRAFGADVVESINAKTLSQIINYDVVIVIAHHDISNNNLELADGPLSLEDFVAALPPDFNGVLDFSSCYSAIVFDEIKDRCPNCLVMTPTDEVGLLLNLVLYPTIIKRLTNKHRDSYIKIYNKVFKKAKRMHSFHTDGEIPMQPSQKLGTGKSSILVPDQVRKTKPFQIIIKLRKDKESDMLSFNTLLLDSNNNLQEGTTTVPIKTGDTISMQLDFISPDRDLIQLHDGNSRFDCVWQGEECTTAFQASVDRSFKQLFFVGRLIISINSGAIGEGMFMTKVPKESNSSTRNIPFYHYTLTQESSGAETMMIVQLEALASRLKKRLPRTYKKEILANYKADLRIIEDCLTFLKKNV
ncbi:MAG: hypothetical protein IJG42_07315 [Muribaculaceae bacterium]|nr:hypothetical protein [Muribaculaceae bacterium]